MSLRPDLKNAVLILCVSASNLIKRFYGQARQPSAPALLKFQEEWNEFFYELQNGNAQAALLEACDVLVTWNNYLETRGYNPSYTVETAFTQSILDLLLLNQCYHSDDPTPFIKACLQVAHKNDAKTLQTHYIAADGTIAPLRSQ